MKKYGFLIFMIGLALLPSFGCSKKGDQTSSRSQSAKEGTERIEYYTCSMHPHIHEDKPGRCPICGMPLVPVYSETPPSPSLAEESRPAQPVESQPSSLPSASTPSAKGEKKILYWVDPMHPWYKSDKPGKAPDCGMDLVPVYEEEGGETPSSKLPGMGTVRLSAEKQQLIGITTEVVERRSLTREITASGRVAFEPDLLTAQREFLVALKTPGGDLSGMQGDLIRAAGMRLKLLGMSEAQIEELKRKGKPQMSLLLPQAGDSVWILGSVFESDLPWVKVGTPVQVTLPGSSETVSSQIESIDPMIDSMTRTGKVRLRVPNPSGALRGDMFVRLLLNAQGEEALVIPENSVLDTGRRQIAFVDKGEGRFEPRELKVGKRGSHFVEVLSGVSAGERVVTNGNFLLDSESRLKAAISGMGDQ